MAGRRVLAGRDFARRRGEAAWRSVHGETGWHAAGRDQARVAEAKGIEMRNVERSRAKARTVGAPGGAGFRDTANSIGAGVAERRSVAGSAAPDGIEHDEKRARHDQI